MKKFDLIVIGAGRASNLAAKAGNLGKKVALIEKKTLGGTCANRGCVPSKLLIGYANKIREIKSSKNHFIDSTINKIDLEKIFEQVNTYISKVEPKYKAKFNENVEIFKGVGKFISDYVVEVNGEKLTAPKIVIATGTRPVKAPFEDVWTSDDIFPFTHKVPKSITIVGGGVIACELANFFEAVGVTTKQLVRGKTLLKQEDSDILEVFEKEYRKNIDVLFETNITEINSKNDSFSIKIEDKDKNSSTFESEAILYATGRVSNADTLNLENTQIKLDEKNFIKRDEFFETNVKGVYVVGDASGVYQLQHAAAYEVNYLSKILFENEKIPLKFKYMPHGVFSLPEIASVGLTEDKAKELNLNYSSNITNWSASAKALSLRESYPITKFIVDKNYKILGCHIIGHESTTMMHQVLAVLHIDNDIRHLKEMLYIHPALNEALLPAAVDIINKIETKNKQ